ncbi:MAG: hypothetical protein AAF387_13495 [Pseudomonadota bacterium]
MSKPFIDKVLKLSALIILSVLLCTQSSADDLVPVRTVDFKGKPPFKRQVEYLPAADIAALETGNERKTTRVRSVDFRGKPPFRRNVETLEVVDLAPLEVEDNTKRRVFRGKPPFKR